MIDELVFGSLSPLKGSDIKKLKEKFVTQFPSHESIADEFFNKKANVSTAKANDRGKWIVLNNQILFFEDRNGNLIPHLKVLHKYPGLIPKIRCDQGAAKPILRGADLMVGGVTDRKTEDYSDLKQHSVVGVYIGDLEPAIAVGYLEMTPEQLATESTGRAIVLFHVCGDDLWKNQQC